MLALLSITALAFHGPAVTRVGGRSAVAMSKPAPTVIPVKNSWVKVCDANTLKPNTLNPTFAAGQDILVAVDKSGTVYATANVCPHIGTPLDQGTVEDGAIVCPLHRSAFDLRSGKLVGPWCPAPPLIGPLTGKLKSPRELKTFQVRTSGGNVQVLLDVNAKKRFDASYWRGILDAQGKVDGGYY
jgi:nitrite reductase/ring-hydroxylating ferredoxin subunit